MAYKMNCGPQQFHVQGHAQRPHLCPERQLVMLETSKLPPVSLEDRNKKFYTQDIFYIIYCVVMIELNYILGDCSVPHLQILPSPCFNRLVHNAPKGPGPLPIARYINCWSQIDGACFE